MFMGGRTTIALLVITLLGLTSSVEAQEANSDATTADAQIQRTLNDSKSLFRDGSSDDQAETKLQAISTATANSGQWHMEAAMNLLRVAFSCKESNDLKTAQRVALRVLVHLALAEKLFAGDSNSLSSVYEIRGVVREQLVGDTNQALQNYQSSVKLNPDNDSANRRVQLLKGGLTTQ